MGIVASDAGETGIWVAPAFTVFEAVRRKTNVEYTNSDETSRHNIFPGAVACPAEVYGCDRIQTTRIHNCLRTILWCVRFHRSDVHGTWSVASFAGDSKRCTV